MDLWPADLAAEFAAAPSDLDVAPVCKRYEGLGYAAQDPIRPLVSTFGTYRFAAGAILARVPEHKTWVEPFGGALHLFLSKKRSPREVVNDADERLVRIWRFLQGASDADLARLKARDWQCTAGKFAEVKAMVPRTDADWTYKAIYLSNHALIAQAAMRHPTFSGGVPHAKRIGKTTDLGDRLEKVRERLQGVEILNEDYRKVFEKYAGDASAFWMLDPPYPSTAHYYHARGGVDFDDLGARVKALKGKWAVLYEATPAWKVFAGPGVERARLQRKLRSGYFTAYREGTSEDAQPNGAFAFVISNVPGYAAGVSNLVSKALGDELLDDFFPPVQKRGDKAPKTVPIFKAGAEEERFVFGEVLVPEDRDAQGDIYSEEVVREAAHGFLAKFARGRLGLQHRARLVNEVDLLESYVALVDFTVPGTDRQIKKGTWLMAWRVRDDDLWAAVKSGEITGFSIGGTAVKKPG